jgi:hypothetical protein
MFTRAATFLLALWWLAVTCVIVPGHTRGAVTVDGRVPVSASGGSVPLFFSSVSTCCQAKAPAGSKAPVAPNPTNCIVCKLVGHVGCAAGVPVDFSVAPAGETTVLAVAAQVGTPERVLTLHGRAPPAVLL